MTKINKEGWEIKKLGEVCTIERGGSPRPIQNYITDSVDGLNWIKIGDAVEGSKYITKTAEKIIPEGLKKTRWVEKGDFILSNSMSFGRPYILEIDGCIHDGWLVIHGVEENFNKDFLYYYLSSPVVYATFKKMAVGGVVNNLNSKMVRDLQVPIPEKEIQRRIVEELDEINAIISAKKQQLSKLDELAQSIFYDMFGDPVANEKGWEVKKLGEETTEIKYGTSSPACPNGKYKYLRMCNISYDGHLDFSDLKYIDVPDAEIEKCIVRYGDILFNRTNSLELIGKTCMFDVEEPMVIAGYIIRVRLTEKLHPRYVSVAFNLPSMKKLLRNMAKGAVNQANINSKELASINIPLPPLPLQETFATRVSAIEEQKSSIAASIEKMQTLLDARMQEYFG